jgi:hypothetical protein
MSNYHHSVVTRRPLYSAPTQANPVAEVVFEAEDPHSATAVVLDALDALGFPKAGSGTLSEFSNIVRLDGLPSGVLADKPDWSNDAVKVWLIRSSTQTMRPSAGGSDA